MISETVREKAPPTASVVIAAGSRSQSLTSCLDKVLQQTPPATEVLVVDCTRGGETYHLVTNGYPGVQYLRHPAGAGTTAECWQIGAQLALGEVVAFLTDAARPRQEWLAELLAPYTDPAVGGVGGRLSDGGPAGQGAQIGMLLPNGTLTYNFTLDPGHPIDVDHLAAGNHSFRRIALLRTLGRPCTGYRGTGYRRSGYDGDGQASASETALTVQAAGWRLRYAPAAVLDQDARQHRPPPPDTPVGGYADNRDQLLLLSRAVGIADPRLRRYVRVAGVQAVREVYAGVKQVVTSHGGPDGPATGLVIKQLGRRVNRAGAITAGVTVGFAQSAIGAARSNTTHRPTADAIPAVR